MSSTARLPGSHHVGLGARVVDPPRLGRLLPSRRQLQRHAATLHAAWLVEQDVTIAPTNGERYTYRHVYPSFVSVCGVTGLGEGVGPVTCRRCLRIVGHLLESEESR